MYEHLYIAFIKLTLVVAAVAAATDDAGGVVTAVAAAVIAADAVVVDVVVAVTVATAGDDDDDDANDAKVGTGYRNEEQIATKHFLNCYTCIKIHIIYIGLKVMMLNTAVAC